MYAVCTSNDMHMHFGAHFRHAANTPLDVPARKNKTIEKY